MHLIVYTQKKPLHHRIVRRLSEAFTSIPIEIEQFLPRIDTITKGRTVSFVGLLYGMHYVYNYCMENKVDFLYVDHAYFFRGYDPLGNSWLRITKNNLVQNTIKTYRDLSREQEHFSGINLKPWRGLKGKYILVSPPSQGMTLIYPNCTEWFEENLERLKKSIDLPVRVRIKSPKVFVDQNGIPIEHKSVPNRPLMEDLKDAALVLTFNSNISVDASIEGIPVVVHEQNACWPISQQDLTQIKEPDRTNWLYSLFHSQFLEKEIGQGQLADLVNLPKRV
jgi:hypothetical protein